MKDNEGYLFYGLGFAGRNPIKEIESTSPRIYEWNFLFKNPIKEIESKTSAIPFLNFSARAESYKGNWKPY